MQSSKELVHIQTILTGLPIHSFVITPGIYLIYSTIHCTSLNISNLQQISLNGRFCIIIASVLLINFFLFKLKLTFEGSAYATNKCIQNILFGFLYISNFILMVIYIIYTKTPCIYQLFAWDYGKDIFMCVDHFQGYAGLALFAIFGLNLAYNILLGFMFVYKLHRVLESMKHQNRFDQHTLEMEELIIKNTLIYIATLCTTLISYILWFMDIFDVNFTIHFDALFNCIMIALMYKYNDKYYLCLCGFCLQFCQRLYSRDQKMLTHHQSDQEIAECPSPSSKNTTTIEL